MAEFSTPLKKKSSIPINIAFQGEIASYTYLASQSFFSRFALNLHYTSTKSLKNLFKSLERGEVTYGITPLESSSYGTIHGVYDMLLASNGSFTIIGEIGQIEELNLCVPQD
jgi:chorismate mutase/prephenate dehydratase